MRIKSKYALLAFLMLLTLATSGQLQEFKFRAKLDAVMASGFYKIPVTPQLSAVCKGDLSDIRVVSDSNAIVPYIKFKEPKIYHVSKTRNCPILTNATEGKFTNIILKNPLQAGIASLSLIAGNTASERHLALSGSDDNKNWYTIDDSLLFRPAYKNNEGKYEQNITFPYSKYTFFRARINNTNSDPLKITRAFVTEDTTANKELLWFENPRPSFSQKDSNRQSHIVIKNDAPYLTNKIYLNFSGPKFYNRTGSVFFMHSDNDSGNLTSIITNFTASSDSGCVITVEGQKAKTILVIIDNQDNPPLRIVGVETKQEQQFLVAWLERGKEYSLKASNPNIELPQFDLSYFKSKIPAQLPTLNFGKMTAVTPQEKQNIVSSRHIWLWPTIIISVLLLSYLTFRLSREVTSKTS